MGARSGRWTEGYRLTLWLVVAAGLLVLVVVMGGGSSGEGSLRLATRWTVGIGSVFFSAAFAASSLNAFARAPWSKWLLRNRRYVGLSFAGIHFLHAACFIALALLYPESFWRRLSIVTLVGGSVGYAWLVAMTVTSFDATTRAIGKRAWTILHKSGMYVLWGILVFSYVGKVPRVPAYMLLVAPLVTAALLRPLAVIRARTLARHGLG
jgi:DMSO/TMAO reductase YedYZ heme-binding membrane subunit